MLKLFKTTPVLYSFSLAALLTVLPAAKKPAETNSKDVKIQAAILLDVSNSMDGLIEQAKAQLWNMVNVLGRADCQGVAPKIEIALYEYGRSSNDASVGYIKQIAPFSSDLDKLSQQLFNLSTNGGSEYCGHVIYTSLNELKWDDNGKSYKVIFIAGNEDFLQGTVSYTKACEEAKKKSVIVNTIYCGDKMQGIKEHWNLLGECGNGSYTNINSDAKPVDIPTPYDSVLMVLNTQLNNTYIYYGSGGKEGAALQKAMDNQNQAMNYSVGAKRTAAKANKGVYDNSGWDLVDAARSDKSVIEKVEMNTLPEELQKLSRSQLKQVIEGKESERNTIQKTILETNNKRDAFIAKEKAKNAGTEHVATLETEIEKIIRQQASRFQMKIR